MFIVVLVGLTDSQAFGTWETFEEAHEAVTGLTEGIGFNVNEIIVSELKEVTWDEGSG